MMPASPAGEASSDIRQIQLSVQGMTCASCAARVEKQLNMLDGVLATVNFATEKATVTVPVSVPVERLVEQVEQAGYGAEVAAADGGGPDAARVAYLRRRLIVALIFFVPLSDLSVLLSLFPAYRFAGWQWVLVALAAPVAGWAAWPFHRAALTNARHGSSSMDTLVSLGVTAACGWSVYAMFFLDRGAPRSSARYLLFHASGGGVYLEVAASVTTFLLAGRWYEARARRRAGDAMRELAASAASDACVLADDGTEQRVRVDQLRAGQRFVVRPGETVAADGKVLFGQSALDRSMMTGESVPAEVAEGDIVTAGTIVVAGRLIVRAAKVGNDTQLAHLVALVDQAQLQKAAIQRVADRIAGVFVPVVLALAVITLAGWLAAGGPAEKAFSAGLAVLIIACPCALGLATPAALVVASGRGAQLGIFIKGYQALESSRTIDAVVLDKTGTITTGVMAVTGAQPAAGVGRDMLLRYAGAVELASEHPVAAAISATALSELGSLPQAGDFSAVPGLGVRGVVDGREVIVGRERLFRDRHMAVPEAIASRCAAWEQAGRTAVLAGWDGQAQGAIAVADTLKPSAAGAIAALRRLGLRTILLTGDSEATAQAVAKQAGVDEVIAGAMPAGKVAVIRDLQARGRRVAMVGDGVNDGPALVAADLGLAVGSGTDVAICGADMILLRNDLNVVPEAISLARGTFITIRRNLAWAFGYNIAAIPWQPPDSSILSSPAPPWRSRRPLSSSAAPGCCGSASRPVDAGRGRASPRPGRTSTPQALLPHRKR